MAQGGSDSGGGTSGATSGITTNKSKAGQSGRGATREGDVASLYMEPAANALGEAMKVLPTLKITREYRARVEAGVVEIERQLAAIKKVLK